MYTHAIRIVGFLGSTEAERVANTLWSVSQHIGRVDPTVTEDLRLSLAADADPLLDGRHLDRDGARGYITTVMGSRPNKVHVLLRGAQAGSDDYWQGTLYLSSLSHLTLDRFGHVEDLGALATLLASCSEIHLVRDLWNTPLAGTPVVAYLVAKMETRALRPVFQGEFSEAGSTAYLALESALSQSRISTLELPRSRKERRTFTERCDEILGKSWIETELATGLALLDLSPRDWLDAK